MVKCHQCGHEYPAELGRYGCPNCHGEGLDALRLRFLATSWLCHFEGMRVHEWIEANRLRLGGVIPAIDYIAATLGGMRQAIAAAQPEQVTA